MIFTRGIHPIAIVRSTNQNNLKLNVIWVPADSRCLNTPASLLSESQVPKNIGAQKSCSPPARRLPPLSRNCEGASASKVAAVGGRSGSFSLRVSYEGRRGCHAGLRSSAPACTQLGGRATALPTPVRNVASAQMTTAAGGEAAVIENTSQNEHCHFQTIFTE